MINKLILLNQKRQMLIGASLIRIGFALIIIYNYTIHYSQRYFLWGANGVIGYSDDSIFSLYFLNHSQLYFDLLYHLGIIIAIAFLFGYKGRITSILNFIFTWSLMTVNGVISDGGDNILRILLFYLLFVDTTAYYSIDSYLRSKSKSKLTVNSIPNTQFSIRNLVHNLAILACLVQVCILYFTSGLHKAMGELWQSGTALYYILQVEEFTHPFFRDIILSSDILIVVGSYTAIIVQVAFPFMLFNRFTKYIAMTSIVSLHFGIAIVMGLYTFSAIMIFNQLLFLTDEEYTSFMSKIRQRYKRILGKLKTKKQMSLENNTTYSNFRPIIIFYDGWCPFCKKSIRRFQRLDWFNRIEFKSFRNQGVVDYYQLNSSKLEKRIHSIKKSNNEMEEGIHSIKRLCKNIPTLWIFTPLLSFLSLIGLGQKIYDFIADRRTIFPTGGCDETSCEIPINTNDK